MRRITVYLAVTFALTWSLWLLLPDGMIVNQSMTGRDALLMAAGMFMPAAGALVTAFRFRKSDPVQLPWRVKLRGNARYYLLAWFAPALLVLSGGALYFAVFRTQFDPMGGWTRKMLTAAGLAPAQEAVRAAIAGNLFAMLTYAPLLNLLFGAGEELGWRGFLYPALCERFGVRRAMVLGGVIWGIWHAPVTGKGHNYGTAYPGYPILGILVMCLFCTVMGILLYWLAEKSGTVWTAALAHGALNAAINQPNLFLTETAEPQLLLGPSAAGVLAMLPSMLLACLLLRRLVGKR